MCVIQRTFTNLPIHQQDSDATALVMLHNKEKVCPSDYLNLGRTKNKNKNKTKQVCLSVDVLYKHKYPISL